MADSTSVVQPDLSVPAPVGRAKKLPKGMRPPEVRKTKDVKRSSGAIAGQAVIWIACLVVSGGSLVPLTELIKQESSTLMLLQTDQAGLNPALQQPWPRTSGYLEALSELELSRPDAGASYNAAQQATRLDPDRAFAWANLAYLEFAKAKAVTAAVLNALTQSMDACPLCSDPLIRWRFNFVLANWNTMPEVLRRRAFEQADLLRWSGLNGEFLAEMRAKAKAAGIAYDAYRLNVKTPVRSWDLAPAPQARLASASGRL